MHRGMAMLAGLLLCPWTVGAQEADDVFVGPAAALGGDRVRVQRRELRLYGIAALGEPGSSGGAGATKLADVIAGRPLTCAVVAVDGSEPATRRAAVCKVGGLLGSDIAAIMVDAGWASADKSRSLRRARPELIKLYVMLEVEARAACLGLWRTQPACNGQSRQ